MVVYGFAARSLRKINVKKLDLFAVHLVKIKKLQFLAKVRLSLGSHFMMSMLRTFEQVATNSSQTWVD